MKQTVTGNMLIAQSGGPLLRDMRLTCTCACGAKTEFPAQPVRHGEIKSCGCLSKKSKPVDPGAVFSRLTVLRWEGKTCFCRCACGREVSVETKSLKSGNTQSCGCLSAIRSRERSLQHTPVGSQFGRLTVKEVVGDHCICVCDHGGDGAFKEVRVRTVSLHNESVRSCGCLRADLLRKRSEKPVSPGDVFGRLRGVGGCFWGGRIQFPGGQPLFPLRFRDLPGPGH